MTNDELRIRLETEVEDFAIEARRIEAARPLVDRLRAGAQVVKFAYQPTFMPHLNILGLVAACADMASSLSSSGRDVVPLVLVVDDDVVGERRFSRADVPGQHRTSYLRSGYASGSRKTLVRHAARASEAADFDSVHAQWDLAVRQMALGRSESRAAADALDPTWWPGWYDSLSLKCVHALSVLAFDVLRKPVMFARLSRLRSASRSLLLEIREVAQSQAPLNLWTTCQRCNSRLGAVLGPSKCTQCGYCQTVSPDGYPFDLIPTAVLDDLLDYQIPGVVAGVSYAAGAEHLRTAMRVAQSSGLPFGPEFVWSSTRQMSPRRVSSLGDLENSELAGTGRAGLPFWIVAGGGLEENCAQVIEGFTDRSELLES